MLVSVVESLKEEINALKTANSVERPSVCADFSTDTMRIPAPTPISNASKAAKTSQNHDKNSMQSSMVSKSVPLVCQNLLALSLISLALSINILSSLDSSIQSQSIKDSYRLGKFSTGASRPRPLLIKFVRVADVTSILSKKRNLSNPYSIKPDMSSRVCANERKVDPDSGRY